MDKFYVYMLLSIILYHIVAIVRFFVFKYVFKKKEPFFYYFADIRVNVFLAWGIIAIFLLIYVNVYSTEEYNYLFSLEWLLKN